MLADLHALSDCGGIDVFGHGPNTGAGFYQVVCCRGRGVYYDLHLPLTHSHG